MFAKFFNILFTLSPIENEHEELIWYCQILKYKSIFWNVMLFLSF
jgi:hypothetical protein